MEGVTNRERFEQAAKLETVDRLLEQAPALIGVILGALATIVAMNINDKLRWKRVQSVRWDERRLDAYAEYARSRRCRSPRPGWSPTGYRAR
jgi:hypothetical protein